MRKRDKLLAERIEIDAHGIIMHQKGSIGRHRLGDTCYRLICQRTVKRQHPLVCGIVDIAAEFDRDGAVATWQNTGRGERRGHAGPH